VQNAFVLIGGPTGSVLLGGITQPKNHFGKACDKLGVQVIGANDPQTKGRLERNPGGVNQDRFIKELCPQKKATGFPCCVPQVLYSQLPVGHMYP